MSSVTRRSFPVLLFVLVGLVVLAAVEQPASAQSTTADVVYGQGGSFTTNTANKGGVSANSLDSPAEVALDSSGNLYVADFENNRVLFYPSGSTTATRVYGQGGSFTTNTANKGGISPDSLDAPFGVALDSSGNLYVADTFNNRVLFYPSGSTTATRVYGQGGSFTSNIQNNGGISADSLDEPNGIALDSNGNFYVADQLNSRVLFYPSGSTTATQVYGQLGSFTTNNLNNGGVSANSLYLPYGVALDSRGNLYVADGYNNRVLFYLSGSTTATRVYGQGGSFTNNTANKGGISANSLADPWGVALDSSGNLYVADAINNRALFYPSGSTTATRVYGQFGSFTTNIGNNGGVSANSLHLPFGVALDSSGNLYVSDYGNYRVLLYPPTTTPGIYSPVNQSTLAGNSVTFWWVGCDCIFGATAYWLDIGSSYGGNNYLQSGSLPGSQYSLTVNSLPNDGSQVYVTWWYELNFSWSYTEYEYTAFGGASQIGVITSPAPNSTLSGSTVTFTWTAGTQSTAYWIDAGSVPGGNQYYQSGNLGNVLSATVPGLPTNGSTVYITLWSEVNGQWLNNQYTYTAFNVSGSQGVLTTPTPGSTLPGSTVTFDWTAGAGASAYWLDLGSVPGGNQYYQSGNLGNVLTTTVNGLPTNGSAVYATLYSLVGGQWMPNAYTYTAFNQAGALGVMQTPTPGSTLNGNQATFTWSAGSASSAYWLDIGSTPGGNNYYQSGNLGNVLTTTVNTLPANNSQIYVTLYSLVGGQWFNNAYNYTSAPGLPPKVIMSIVLDRSGSMVTDGGSSALASAVPTFVNLFNNSTDDVALVSFSSNARIDFPIGVQFQGPISNFVENMVFAGGTFGTGAGDGALLSYSIGAPMSLADAQNNDVQLIQGQSVVKVLVYFTDGLMNALQDNFYCGPSVPSVVVNYGGYDSPVTDVGFFDPTCSPSTSGTGCTNESGHVSEWGVCTNGCPSGFPYDAAGDICKNAQGQPVTTFLSQQTGQQTTFTRANVTAEAQYRAVFTAGAMRTEAPVPTYIYTIGLGPDVSSATQAFLAQLANDPSYSTYNPTQPAGEFFWIQNCPGSSCTAELTEAFQTIASKLLPQLPLHLGRR